MHKFIDGKYVKVNQAGEPIGAGVLTVAPEAPVDAPEVPVDAPEAPVDAPEAPVGTPAIPADALPAEESVEMPVDVDAPPAKAKGAKAAGKKK